MKYEVTYTVKGFLTCFRDVVEVHNIDDCEAEVKKLVEQYTGFKKSISTALYNNINSNTNLYCLSKPRASAIALHSSYGPAN